MFPAGLFSPASEIHLSWPWVLSSLVASGSPVHRDPALSINYWVNYSFLNQITNFSVPQNYFRFSPIFNHLSLFFSVLPTLSQLGICCVAKAGFELTEFHLILPPKC